MIRTRIEGDEVKGDFLRATYLPVDVDELGDDAALALACLSSDRDISPRLLLFGDTLANLSQFLLSSDKTVQAIMQEATVIG